MQYKCSYCGRIMIPANEMIIWSLAPILSCIHCHILADKTKDVKDITQPNIEQHAERHNTGKPDLSLLPKIACEEECKVWEFGSKKYGRSNWRKLWGNDTPNVAGASLLRHALAIVNGELIDKESGLAHAAHIRANAAMILEWQYRDKEKEIRPEEYIDNSNELGQTLKS